MWGKGHSDGDSRGRVHGAIKTKLWPLHISEGWVCTGVPNITKEKLGAKS
jgi:hypothetical protein